MNIKPILKEEINNEGKNNSEKNDFEIFSEKLKEFD